MHAKLLHVVAAVSNPIRYASRDRLLRPWVEHMLDSGVALHLVECAYGDRPFEYADLPHVHHVGVRAKSLVWCKENLLNIGLSRLPEGWKQVATIDADVHFRRPDWAAETVHALQQYEVVQPWEHCYDLGPQDQHLEVHTALLKLWHERKPIMQGPKCGPNTPYKFGHPGYAWAWTRNALEAVGGLIDTAALGAADHHMGLALLGKVGESIHGGTTPEYALPLHEWQRRAMGTIASNVSYVDGTIEHRWHGPKKGRGYVDRWNVLVKHRFNPFKDLKRNTFGVYELAGNKPELRHDIDRYFRSRNEDATTL